MKVAVIDQFIKDFNEVQVKENFPVPTVKHGHVLVKVFAASVNPVDKLVTHGYMSGSGWTQSFPFTVGYDFAGVVEAVGEEVSNVASGDEVFASNWGQGKHNDDGVDTFVGGAFGEYILIPAHKLSKKPVDLSFESAAAIGIVGTTAYEALFEVGQITNQSRVLILGGSSAVGSLAVQIAKLVGAYVATTASSRSIDFVKNLGADEIINYNTQQWYEIVSDIDLVFDCVGEANALENTLKYDQAVKRNGRFVSIANFAIGLDPAGHPPLSFAAAICFKQNTKSQNQIAQWLEEGKVSLAIDEVFPFTTEGVRALLNKAAGGKSLGKNVLKIV